MITLEQVVEYLHERFNIYLWSFHPLAQFTVSICRLTDDEMDSLHPDPEWRKINDLFIRDGLCIAATTGKTRETPKGKYTFEVKQKIDNFILNRPYLEAMKYIEERIVKGALSTLRSEIKNKENTL